MHPKVGKALWLVSYEQRAILNSPQQDQRAGGMRPRRHLGRPPTVKRSGEDYS